MSLLSINLDGGQTDAALSLMPFGSLFSGSGVLTSASLTVAAQISPDMTVKVSGSANNDKLIIITSTGATYFIKNTAVENVTILANSSGVTKTDAIVVYVDLADGDPNTAGSPGAAHVIAVRRAGVSTGAPTDGEIDAATSNNPWFKLAQVVVSNGASSITSGNITDSRTRCKPWLPAAADTVDSAAILDDAVTRAKLGTGALAIVFIPLYAYSGSPGTSYVTIDPSKATIDFSKLVTNAAAAYFRATGNNSGGGITTNIILRYDTDGVNITGSELTVTATGATESTSGNILANLPTTSKRMAYQVKTTSGGLAFHRVVLEIHY
jgi:hypothetical protein